MKKHLTSILLLLLPAVLIIYAPQAVRGASAGLILWFNQVLPVLFPFALILQLIMSVNALSGISCLTAPIMQKMPALITGMQFLPSCRIFMRFSNGNSRICSGT